MSLDKFKLRCLTKYVSYSIFEYIADYETYDEAIAVLDKIFIKKNNKKINSNTKVSTQGSSLSISSTGETSIIMTSVMEQETLQQ